MFFYARGTLCTGHLADDTTHKIHFLYITLGSVRTLDVENEKRLANVKLLSLSIMRMFASQQN
jgi:hypothetical protein